MMSYDVTLIMKNSVSVASLERMGVILIAILILKVNSLNGCV